MRKKKKTYSYYRRPKTTAERRANQEGWCRGKRRPHVLIDSWADQYSCCQKTWKTKREKQYHTGGRGERHVIIITPLRDSSWRWPTALGSLEIYCEDHNIPFSVETIRGFNWKRNYRWVKTGTERRNIGTFFYTNPVHTMVYMPGFFKSHYIQHYVFTWWSDKDIGLEYII